MKLNSQTLEIDGIDKEILRDLMADARKPILQIANKIGISGAAIHQRLRKLEHSGVISGSKFDHPLVQSVAAVLSVTGNAPL